jgi:hypothetical protein
MGGDDGVAVLLVEIRIVALEVDQTAGEWPQQVAHVGGFQVVVQHGARLIRVVHPHPGEALVSVRLGVGLEVDDGQTVVEVLLEPVLEARLRVGGAQGIAVVVAVLEKDRRVPLVSAEVADLDVQEAPIESPDGVEEVRPVGGVP